jgi:tetratricopeptide (TPR) repeat protein
LKNKVASFAGGAGRLMPAGIFLAALAWMLYCAVPTLYWGDSAEMASIPCSLGVAHSPGYPLYSQLTRVFASLPFETLPFRINLLSVFLGALATVLFYSTARELTKSRLAGFVAAAGIVSCRSFVYFSLHAEVYMLHMALFFGALYFFARHLRGGSPLNIYVALFLVFVGSLHHLLMAFVFGAAVVYMALLPGHRWRVAAGPLFFLLGAALINLFRSFDAVPEIITYAASTLAGLAAIYVVYLIVLGVKKKGLAGFLATAAAILLVFAAVSLVFGYLPLASARGPAADWWSPKTPANFISLITLQGYESTMPGSRAELLHRLDIPGFGAQASIFVLLLAIPGFVLLIRKQWRYAVFLLLTGVGTLAGSALVQHGKPEALRMPVYAILYLFAGVGAAAVAEWRFFRNAGWRRALGAAAAAAVLFLTLTNLAGHDWRFMNRVSGAYDLGSKIIEDVRTNSILFIGEQTPSIMGYFQSCEPEKLARREIAIIPVSFIPFKWEVERLRRKYPLLKFPDIPDEDSEKPLFRVDDPARVRYALKMIDGNPGRAVYSDFLFMTVEDGQITIPHGTVYQIVPADAEQRRIEEMMNDDRTPAWSGTMRRDATTAENLASINSERGKIYLELGARESVEVYFRKALREFNIALNLYPHYPEAMANKGYCLFFFGQPDKGVALMRKALRYGRTNPRLYEALATVEFRMQTPMSVKEAMGYWQVALALDPHNARALQNIASGLVALKEKDAAIQYYRKAIEIDKDYISPYINLARVYNQENDCAQAAEILEMAKDRRPDSIEVRSELAQQYSSCNMRFLYAQEMDSLLNDFPKDIKLLYTLAIIFRNVGQLDNFVFALKEIKHADPTFPIQKLFTTLSPCERAIDLLKKTITKMPDEAQLYLTLGLRYAACDSTGMAVKTLEDSVRRFPKEQAFRFALERVKYPEKYIPREIARESYDPYSR